MVQGDSVCTHAHPSSFCSDPRFRAWPFGDLHARFGWAGPSFVRGLTLTGRKGTKADRDRITHQRMPGSFWDCADRFNEQFDHKMLPRRIIFQRWGWVLIPFVYGTCFSYASFCNLILSIQKMNTWRELLFGAVIYQSSLTFCIRYSFCFLDVCKNYSHLALVASHASL